MPRGQTREQNRDYMRRKRTDPEFLARNAENARRWRLERPEYHRLITAARKAREYGVPSTLTLDEWLAAIDKHDGRCAYCFGPFDCLDHVVPLSEGGSNSADNVVPACSPCNMRKDHPTGWLPSIASSLWPAVAERAYAAHPHWWGNS